MTTLPIAALPAPVGLAPGAGVPLPLASNASAHAFEAAFRPAAGAGASALNGAAAAAPTAATSWSQLAAQWVGEVSGRQAEAGAKVRDVLVGGGTAPHEAVIAMEEASISFQLLAETRNRLVEAYQEVQRMQV